MMRRLIAFAWLCGVQSLISVVAFQADALPYLLGSVAGTIVLSVLLLKLWTRLRNPWLRFGTSLLASWTTMVIVVILSFLVIEDPFALERIAQRGWLLYLLLDKVARGLILGASFASIAFVWVWVPVGAFWYFLLRWALGRELKGAS